MSTTPANQLPGQGNRRTASPRTPILSGPEFFPGGLIIDGILSRDAGNTLDEDVLRAGNIMGRVTASVKFRPAIIGLSAVLHDTSATPNAMTLPAPVVTELKRLFDLTVSITDFKISGPAVADTAPVNTETVTIVAFTSATVIDITGSTTTNDFAIGSLIQPADGGEGMLGIIHNGTGLKVTDQDRISQDADFPEAIVGGGVVDSDQLINFSSDTAVQDFIKAQLRLNSSGFVFDDDFNG